MISVQVASMLLTSGVVCGVLGFLSAIPYLKKRNINIDGALNKVKNIADTSGKILDVADEVLPNNPVIFFLKNFDKWAKIAAGEAEQLSHAGDISSDKRLETAQNAVYNILNELNIELTDNRKALIDSSIQDAVNELGHKDTTEAEKAAAMEKLQVEKAQLASENTQLKQAIAQFTANTAGTVQSTAQTS